MVCGHKTNQGFTIVEILIVVIVIAILATIAIISYNGAQDKAKGSAAMSTVSQLSQKMTLFYSTNKNKYPSDASALTAGIGYTLGPNDKYIVNNSISPAQYCLSVAPNGVTNSYAMTSVINVPIKGVCVTNYSLNPGFESTTTQPSNTHYGASSNWVINSFEPPTGYRSLLIKSLLSSNGEAMRFIQGNFTVLDGLVPGTQYTFAIDMLSYNAFANDNTNQRRILFRWSGPSSGVVASAQLANSKTSGRLFVTGTAPTNATGIMFQINHWGTSTDPSIVVDNAMITEGSTHYTYRDGSSTGWWWTGTPNLSTSVGPAEVLQ